MSMPYAYMWEYFIYPEFAQAFEQAYGPTGDWVQLFRRGEGYLRTELHKDLRNPLRYLTVDHWQSEQACKSFRQTFKAEFEALDRRCNRFTRSERHLGDFKPVP